MSGPGTGTFDAAWEERQAADNILAVLELLSTTEALIANSITERTEKAWFGASVSTRTTAYCRHCVRGVLLGQPIDHAPSCIVGQAVAAVAAVAAVRPALPCFSKTEVAALRRMDAAISDAIEANPAPGGILRAASTPTAEKRSWFAENFLRAEPVRHIEYEVPQHPWASEEGCIHPAVSLTHEVAAAERAPVFQVLAGGDAK